MYNNANSGARRAWASLYACIAAMGCSGTQGSSNSETAARPVEVSLASLPDFKSPPTSVRMKVRFASVDVAAGLQELAKTGFGAVEIGADLTDPAGLAATLHAARAAGLAVDLAPGGSMPYSAAGIGEADSMQQLSRATIPLISDGTLAYTGGPPRPSETELAPSPTLQLVAVTAARVIDDDAQPVVLDADSAIDLTPMVSNNMLQWTVPDGTWLLFGFWQRATGQTPNGFPPFQDPSVWSATVPMESPGRYFMADIFSGAGIAKALSPLADLPQETIDLLRGSQFAHDSHEVQAEMFWTGALPRVFNEARGYSVIPYLPALRASKEAAFDPLTVGWGIKPPLAPDYTFSNDVGTRVRYDYHRTLNDLYVGEYLETFTRTLNQYGMSSRAQVAYNYLPLNMTRAGCAVDIPENESFDSGWTLPHDTTLPKYGTERWRHALDSYRLTGSGVHLNHGKRATVEFGDDFAIYRKQPVDFATQLNEALAGGITLGLLTGFAGVNDAWPDGGPLAAIGIGDFWTTAWPQWRDWPQLTDYFARSTLVLETGKPQMDVLIYLDEGIAGVHELTTPKFASSRLETAGYTYDFIDPITLQSPHAQAVPGTLFGKGAAYRALVLNQQPRVPVETAQAILAAARGGVAIVVVGDAPAVSSSLKDASANDAAVVNAMSELKALSNVTQVASPDNVASALLSLGIEPAASFGESSALMSAHRRTDAGEDIYWLFNPSDDDVATTARLRAQGTPYKLDFWNGTIAKVARWSATEKHISVPVVVPPRGTTAYIFQQERAPLHITSTTADDASYDGETLVLRDQHGGEEQVTLSDGHSHTVRLPEPPAELNVADWTLEVDEISPTGRSKHSIELHTLQDWREIPSLEHVVGSGLYTAKVEVPKHWLGSNLDVMIDVGAVAGGMQLSVNDTIVTRQTVAGGSWSVKSLLHAGQNIIAVRLDTTLLNRVAQINSGMFETAPSGLLGPVRLIPVALGRLP
jgi:hypothetical protein